MWPGTTATLMKMMRLRPWSVLRQAAWSCCTCLPIARGSTPLNCCGAIFAVRSHTANYSKPSSYSCKQPNASFSVTTNAHLLCCLLLAVIPHNLFDCTWNNHVHFYLVIVVSYRTKFWMLLPAYTGSSSYRKLLSTTCCSHQ